MGLFGGGDSSSNTTVETTNNNPTSAPQISQAGASGSLASVAAPTLAGNFSSIGPTSLYTYYAPVNVVPSTNVGDSAIAASAQTAQTLAATSTGQSSPIPSWLTNLFQGVNLYWTLGTILVFLLARGHPK